MSKSIGSFFSLVYVMNLFLGRFELGDIGVVALLNFIVNTLQDWLLLQAARGRL